MARRTLAINNGKYIGIESIFTVINGKQINIPEKLKELRIKSQNNELFCPCGCGANLILVAGDKNIREQHFRIKDGQSSNICTYSDESEKSVESKIVLKCWLDDNLRVKDIESRVPICDLSDSSRKYEFTFISRSSAIALDYCNNRVNLSDEKQSILEQNSNGIHIIHVVDYINGSTSGQYPEGLMKIQTRQKYCLLLANRDAEYDAAKMKAVFYRMDINGLWKEITIAEGYLKEFRIEKQGSITFRGNTLNSLLKTAIQIFDDAVSIERHKREEERKAREEELLKQKEEYEQRQKELQKYQEELEEKRRIKAEEEKKKRLEQEELERIRAEKALEEKKRRKEEFERNLESLLEQQEKRVIDEDGNRWVKCEFCGKKAKTTEFVSYGGPVGKQLNIGICKHCFENNPEVEARRIERKNSEKKKYDPTICPECGGMLILRNGKYGKFMACSNYPKCNFTRRASN